MLLAGAAVSGLGVSVSNAGLLVDVRAVRLNGVNLSAAQAKSVSVALGDTVSFRVFADVTGSNAAKAQALQSLSGSFLSTGALKGNMILAAGGQQKPFNSSGSSVGQLTDLDGDGDLDIGSNTPSDPAGFWAIRSANLTGPRSTDDAGGTVFGSFPPTAIAGGTEYTLVDNLRFIVTNATSQTLVNFRNRVSNTGGLWVENATETSTDNLDGTTAYGYSGGTTFTDTSNVPSGPGVLLTSGGSVPEPTSLGLAALAGLGMLARRRK